MYTKQIYWLYSLHTQLPVMYQTNILVILTTYSTTCHVPNKYTGYTHYKLNYLSCTKQIYWLYSLHTQLPVMYQTNILVILTTDSTTYHVPNKYTGYTHYRLNYLSCTKQIYWLYSLQTQLPVMYQTNILVILTTNSTTCHVPNKYTGYTHYKLNYLSWTKQIYWLYKNH